LKRPPSGRAAAGLLLACAVSIACHDTPPPPWHQEAGYRWRDLEVQPGSPGFTPVSGVRSGLRFQNSVSDSALLGNRVFGQGAGVALGDVDGDGRVDVFLARTEGCSALYRNLGAWKFQDITKTAGVGACDRFSTGAALADIDGDRDLDLVLLSTKGPNAIFVNDGHGVFSERRNLGLDPTGKGGTTIAMADVDGDGRLDLFVANYKAYNVDDSIPPQQRAFNQMVRQVGEGKYEVVPEHRRDYKIVMRPDMGGLRLTVRGATDDFYQNLGGQFERVPLTAGRFLDARGLPLTTEPESFALGAKFVDLNGDGAPDLYVANDFEDPDELWFNNGKGSFRLGDWKTQRQMSNSSMGVDIADINNDALPDIFVVDMLSNDSHRLKTQIPTHTALAKRAGDIESQLQQQRNTLFENRGDGTFAEIAQSAGVGASGWSWGTMFVDVDLDGWQDILIANGHLWDIMDADTQERLQNRLTDVAWKRLRWEFPKLRLRNVAMRNMGNMTFTDASAQWRFGVEPDISHTMAAADLDGDGDMDVVINRLGAPALVLRSESAAPRIAVRLVGDTPNTQAVGAKIRLLGGAQPLQQSEVTAGGLYMSHSDYERTFAMGRADSATLEVEWRDGSRTLLHNVRPNRLYEITTATAATPAPIEPVVAATLFEDATPALGGHVHQDTTFDDWDRQFLLSNSLSQLGPGVTWFDIDRDGDEDLVIGAGRGGRPAVFRNDRGKLVPLRNAQRADGDLTTILGLPSGKKDVGRLLVGVSNWEVDSVPSAVGIGVSRAGISAQTDTVIGKLPWSVGPMALGDYDGDGDLDLFVGGRAISRNYPVAPSSALYRNDHGVFTPDSAASAMLRDVGMVSAAMFSDINGDGHPDLVLAREWGSLLLYLNRDGRLVEAPLSWGLTPWTSRWNGLASGDVDGDGRLDLIATSWGRNTAAQTDSANPLVMFYGPFGAAGEVETIVARKDARIGDLAPLNSYPRMRVVIPDLPSRISSFAAYADATVDQVLGAARSRVRRTAINTQDHMLFLNRGDHFDAVPLPAESQLAPAFYAGVADFDGDGAEDVFLAQNFSATAVGLPRYDAGRGLLLLGDGHGKFTPMAGARSGILVYGDQRGAAYADYDGDGRLDLVVSQNSAATKLYKNRGAKAGLRVRLEGSPDNPDGVGAQLRLVYGAGMSPVREVQAGSGYWSENGAVQVFGRSGTPTEVWVRWPGGSETRTKVAPGAREVVVKASSR
jgi:hypothetical protein